MNVLEYFDIYVGVGLQVIPLYPRSKVPVGVKWNQKWDKEWSREYLIQNPDSNIGMLLGTNIDVEGDTEEANAFLNKILKGYPHPTYQSSKSFHHLFINPDPNLTMMKFGGFEFRAYKHQSVLPPSIHEDGTKYLWQGTSKYPVPAMPDELLEFYFSNRNNRKKPIQKKKVLEVKPGHTKTQCQKCNKKILLHKKRLVLEVKAFLEMGQTWQCQNCREVDVREACRRIRNQHASLVIPQPTKRSICA